MPCAPCSLVRKVNHTGSTTRNWAIGRNGMLFYMYQLPTVNSNFEKSKQRACYSLPVFSRSLLVPVIHAMLTSKKNSTRRLNIVALGLQMECKLFICILGIYSQQEFRKKRIAGVLFPHPAAVGPGTPDNIPPRNPAPLAAI